MLYCGIDLGSKSSAVCLEDEMGQIQSEFEAPTDGDGFRTRLGGQSPLKCVEELGHEVVVIDPRRAKAVICTKNKTDRLDARKLAKMAPTGWYTAVYRKTKAARTIRSLLKARTGLKGTAKAQQSRIQGLLRAHGIKGIGTRGGDFEQRVLEATSVRAPELMSILKPLLRIWRQARQEAEAMTDVLRELTQSDPVCRLLMSVPGVGPVVSAGYVATIDDPGRFDRPDQVSSYLGLVPRVHQSGQTEYRGRITKEGDGLLRWLLVEAANALLTRTKRSCALKSWGIRLILEKGLAKARVAVARKLAVLLHRVWTTGEAFDWARG
jgi:transposase